MHFEESDFVDWVKANPFGDLNMHRGLVRASGLLSLRASIEAVT